VAVTLVFFAMFGALFFVSQYLQFVLAYTPLQSGVRLLPVAAALMVAAPTSARLVGRFGTKRVVTLGLVLVAAALLLFSRVTVSSGYPLVAAVLTIVGIGMGLAMAPATDSIMGSLPPEKAGVGSAMNDTTREIGGALGVAILGSVITAVYGSTIRAEPDFASLQQAAPDVAQAVEDSVGSAAIVAAQLPDAVGRAITSAANEAFVHAVERSVLVGAIVALLGAAVAYFFLPARAAAAGAAAAGEAGAQAEAPEDELVDGTALRLGPEQRRNLAEITLGLLADAGMSSLTYNAVAARSGVGTATLQRYWTSRVDAVTDAIHEVFGDRPVPDTGDLRRDLRDYAGVLRDALADPRAQQVLTTLVAEAASDPELADTLRRRILAPWRSELAARLASDPEHLAVPVDAALDMLAGPIHHRAVIVGDPVDDDLIDALVTSITTAR
jgi:AcrR family transcriptional regulator